MSSSSELDENLVQENSSDDDEVLSDEAGISDDETDVDGESEGGESEADDSAQDESNGQEPAIDASSTESDEDDDNDDVDDDEDIPKKKKVQVSAAKMDKINQDIMERYKKRQGLQLYIRFPAKLPEDVEEFQTKVKSLSELIIKAHKPRQKHARFCLVDFATTEDRDITLKKLTKNKAENKLVVSLPLTDNQDFVKNLAKSKLKKVEKKLAKQLLKKESRRANKQKHFTSTIVVLNVPKSASTAQVKELFPDAVDIQTKPAPSKFNGASIATITLPSTTDAKNNVKRDLTLGGTKLIIRFNNANKKKKKKAPKRKPQKKDGEVETKKGPIAPKTSPSNGNKQKKKNQANGDKASAEQEVPQNKAKLPLSKKRDTEDDGESKVVKKKPKLSVSEEPVSKPSPKKELAEKTDTKVPQKKGKQVGNAKGNNSKFAQKKGNAAPNNKGLGKKPNPQNKQKKKPQKKGKVAAE